MLKAIPAVSAAGLTLFISGCATDLAQGYRSTPDYPAYASANCTDVAADRAMDRAVERYVERRSGVSVPALGPSSREVRGGLLMAFIFAVAEERPMNTQDVCAGMAAAQSSANRRRR